MCKRAIITFVAGGRSQWAMAGGPAPEQNGWSEWGSARGGSGDRVGSPAAAPARPGPACMHNNKNATTCLANHEHPTSDITPSDFLLFQLGVSRCTLSFFQMDQ